MTDPKKGRDYDEWGWVDESPAKSSVALKSIGNTPPITPTKKVKNAQTASDSSKSRQTAQDLLTNYANNIRKLIITSRSKIADLNKEIEELKLQLKSSGVVKCPSCSTTFKERNHRLIPKYIKILRGKFTIELEFANNDLLAEWLTLNGLEKMSDGLPTLLPVKSEDDPTLDNTGSQLKSLLAQKNEEVKKMHMEQRKENVQPSSTHMKTVEARKSSTDVRRSGGTSEKRKLSPDKSRERRCSPEKKRKRNESTDWTSVRASQQSPKPKERERRSNSPRNHQSSRSRGKTDQPASSHGMRTKESSRSTKELKSPVKDNRSPRKAPTERKDHSLVSKETKSFPQSNRDERVSRASMREERCTEPSRREKEFSKNCRRNSRSSDHKADKPSEAACSGVFTSDHSHKSARDSKSFDNKPRDSSRSQRQSERIKAKIETRSTSSHQTISRRLRETHEPEFKIAKKKIIHNSPPAVPTLTPSQDQMEDGEIVDSSNESNDEVVPRITVGKQATSCVSLDVPASTCSGISAQDKCFGVNNLEAANTQEELLEIKCSESAPTLTEPNELAFCSLDESESFDSNEIKEESNHHPVSKSISSIETVFVEPSFNEPLLQTMKFPEFKYSHIAESPGLRISNFDSPDYTDGQTPSEKEKSDAASCTPSDCNSVTEHSSSPYATDNDVPSIQPMESTAAAEYDMQEQESSSFTGKEKLDEKDNQLEEPQFDLISGQEELNSDHSVLDEVGDVSTEDVEFYEENVASTNEAASASDEDSDCDDDMGFGVVVSCEEDILSDGDDICDEDEDDAAGDCEVSENEICTDHDNEYD